MAENINLREQEYQTIVSELSNMHTTQLQNVEDAIKVMKILVTDKSTFSANLTSKKVIDMLDVLSSEVIALLEQAFLDSEAGVANMITSTTATDTTNN